MQKMNQTYSFQNLNEETLKTKIVYFKNNFSEALRKKVAQNKILLSYDDRTDSFYLFSNFTTQYVIMYKERNEFLDVTIFKANIQTKLPISILKNFNII